MKQDICPQCGSTNTVKGKQSGYAAVGKDTFLGGMGQALHHIFFCRVRNSYSLLYQPSGKTKINTRSSLFFLNVSSVNFKKSKESVSL